VWYWWVGMRGLAMADAMIYSRTEVKESRLLAREQASKQ
jgi:hypothetical protein